MKDETASTPDAGSGTGGTDPRKNGAGHGPRTDAGDVPGTPPRRLWVVVLVACAGQFLVVLDVSVVNVALPSMRSELAMDAPGLQWVVNGYTLAFAGLMLLGGRAADIFGLKRTFLVGLGLFTAASLLGGLAQEPWQLLSARALQGTGAAVLAPANLTILTTSFPPGRARTRAIATWTAVGAGGGAAGGLVGGVLTEVLSWRWVLLINVPVGALVLFATAVWVAERRDSRPPRRLDLPGALLVTLGLVALAWGIARTESAGWTAPSVLWPLSAGAVLLAGFVAVESRTRAPLVPLRLFRSRAVSAANGTVFVSGGTLFGMWYFMSLYMQNVLHYTPLQAGLGFVPQSLSIVAGSKAAPRLMARFGARSVALSGIVVSCAGCLWQSCMHAGGGFLETVTGPGVLMALGAGITGTPLAAVAMSGVPQGDTGLVSGLFNTARTMGGSLGLAVFSTIAAARIGDATAPEALASGYGTAFLWAAVALTGCAALALVVLPPPSREGAEA